MNPLFSGIFGLLVVIFLYITGVILAVVMLAVGVAWGIRWGLKWALKEISNDPEIEQWLRKTFNRTE
ncbi:hypothetical protein JT359_02665 [Candidatus Poribacteria bacterium]|nr:hypothetical protein [Candidatus Poribacteria bacterium]